MSIKRVASPREWFIKRKHGTWVTKPVSGYTVKECIPLTLALQSLELCSSSREVKKLVGEGKVMINKRKIRAANSGVGFLDVLSVHGVDREWRLVYNDAKRLSLIPCKDGDKKLVRVNSKRLVPGNKGFQISLTGGVNIVTAKKTIGIGDSLLISLPDLKILEHFKPVKGSLVYVVSGTHVGELAQIIGIKSSEGSQPDMFTLKIGGKEFQTPKRSVLVVGDKKEAVKLS